MLFIASFPRRDNSPGSFNLPLFFTTQSIIDDDFEMHQATRNISPFKHANMLGKGK
jgi:hypothetical protein